MYLLRSGVLTGPEMDGMAGEKYQPPLGCMNVCMHYRHYYHTFAEDPGFRIPK